MRIALNIAMLGVALSVPSAWSHSAGGVKLRTTCANGVELTATVEPVTTTFETSSGNRESRAVAVLAVRNPNKQPVFYTNSTTMLSARGVAPARAYIDSIASMAIDFGQVQLAAGEYRQLKVYWPFQLSTGTRLDALRLQCAQPPVTALPANNTLKRTR